MKRQLSLSIIAAFVLGICLTSAPTSAAEKLSSKDKDLVKRAQRELEMLAQTARLARDRSNSTAVKQYSETALGGYDKMIGQLHDFAKEHDFDFSGDPSKPDVSQKKHLEDLKGQQFDKEYMSTMVHENEQLLQIFEDGTRGADSKDLQNWFEKKQVGVKDYVKDAKDVYNQVKDRDDMDHDHKKDKKDR